MEKITRQEAKRQGLKRYFTGQPCGRGHLCERYVCDAQCYQCSYDKVRARYLADPAADSQRVLNWKRRNPEIAKASWLTWSRKNLGKNRARVSRRRAALLQRMPAWADLKAIRQFYTACPKGMTVDHIIPLNGKEVSGLHVVENLQYLTPSDNSSKKNHYDPEKFPEQQLPLVTLTSLPLASR